MSIPLGNKSIGAGKPCFIIAEAGVNHNGSLELAREMVDAAKDMGADAIKFQTFKAEELATPQVELAKYQLSTKGVNESQLAMLKKLELSVDDFHNLCDYCAKKRIVFLSTPFDLGSVDLLEQLSIPLYKISSGDLNNYPFLQYVAKKGKPMIVSTGMSEMEEIGVAIESIKKAGNSNLILMQCTTAYPTPFEDVNLNAIKTMRNKFGFPVGLSDHTVGIEVSIAAVALGACVIEKHFTLDRCMEGPDHKASIEPKEFRTLVDSIRHVEAALGSPDKKISRSESENRHVARKKIVAARDICAGEKFSISNVTLKRSALGLEPMEFERILSRTAKRKIQKNEPIQEDQVI